MSSSHLPVAFSISLLLLAGCNSVYTSVSTLPLQEPTARLPASGIPYRLPAGLVTLKLSFAESGTATDKRLAPTFEVATSHYPDSSSPFLLLPSHNGLFDTHHVVTVSDGLLSSISTTETSKAKEVILSLVQTGIDLAKLKASPLSFTAQSDAESSSADIFLNDSPHPTDAEVAYALASALGSKLTINLTPAAINHPELPLGSAGLLSVKNSLQPERDSTGSPNECPVNLTPLTGQTPGVYTRALRAYRAESKLVLNLTALHKLRVQAHQKALRALDAEESQQAANAKVREHELSRAQSEFDTASNHWLDLQKRHAALEIELVRHDLTDELRKTRLAARDEATKALTATKATYDAAAAKLSQQKRSEADATTNAFKLTQQRNLLNERLSRYNCSTPGGIVLHTASTVVTLPDPETLIRVPITRSGFGKTSNVMEFKAGVLTKYDSNQTSSLEGFVAIPAGIVNAFAKALVASDSASTAAATGSTTATTAATTTTPAAAASTTATPTTTTTTNTTTTTGTTTTGTSATPPPAATATTAPP